MELLLIVVDREKKEKTPVSCHQMQTYVVDKRLTRGYSGVKTLSIACFVHTVVLLAPNVKIIEVMLSHNPIVQESR